MATTTSVSFCSKCNNEVLPESPSAHCVHCGYVFERPTGQWFMSPKYLSYQLNMWRDKLSADRRRGTKPPSKPEEEQLKLIEADFKRWQIEMHADDRLAALSDAFIVLQYAVMSKTFGNELGALVRAGKQIGELAASIETYVKHEGGLLHAREIGPLPTDSGNSIGGAATAR